MREAFERQGQSGPVREKLGIVIQQLPSFKQINTSPCPKVRPTTLQSPWRSLISCSWRMGEENFSCYLLDSFQSMNHCALHAVQQRWKNTTGVWKRAKRSLILPGPMEKRWAGVAKSVTQSSQMHQQTRDIPPHTKGWTFLLFAQLGTLHKQTKWGSHKELA